MLKHLFFGGAALDRRAAYREAQLALGGGDEQASVDVRTLAESVAKHGTMLHVQDVVVLLQAADTNQDGVISFDEFEGLLDRAEAIHSIALASLYIQDALLGQPISYEKTPKSIDAFSFYTGKWEVFYAVVAAGHILLAFFENPARFDHSLAHPGYPGRPNGLVTLHPILRLAFAAFEGAVFAVYFYDLRLFFIFRPSAERLVIDPSSGQVFRQTHGGHDNSVSGQKPAACRPTLLCG